LLFEDIKDYVVYAGKGVENDPSWIPEDSFLILAIALAHALHLSKNHQQNAFVFAETSRPAELVWSR
jgi:hypothetical protein